MKRKHARIGTPKTGKTTKAPAQSKQKRGIPHDLKDLRVPLIGSTEWRGFLDRLESGLSRKLTREDIQLLYVLSDKQHGTTSKKGKTKRKGYTILSRSPIKQSRRKSTTVTAQ